jgi:hypothetical protein
LRGDDPKEFEMNKQEAMNEVSRLNPNSTSIVALSGNNSKPWVETEFLVRYEGSPLPRRYELYQDGFLWLRPN